MYGKEFRSLKIKYMEIIIKIDKNYKLETTPKDKWLVIDLEEAVQYGSSFVSKIKIEFNSEKEIEDFKAGKRLKLEVSDDKTSVENNNVLVVPHPWTVDRTFGQKTTDTVAKAGEKVKKTSKKATQATGERVEEAGKKMQNWPGWVLPTIIVVGVILLVGIVYLIFRKR